VKGIAFFDFDGTVTSKDSLLEIIKFVKGRRAFYFGMLFCMNYLILLKLRLLSNQLAKEKVLQYFFGGMTVAEFERACACFAEKRLPHILRPKALEEIERLQKKSCRVIVVSASPENWIRPWAKKANVELIASRLETINGRITGKIDGKNCCGGEKVRRIFEQYDLSEFADVYAYGDTKADLEMLALATYSYFKPFRN
jgi:phosphatidylglycerophosphatase C